MMTRKQALLACGDDASCVIALIQAISWLKSQKQFAVPIYLIGIFAHVLLEM